MIDARVSDTHTHTHTHTHTEDQREWHSMTRMTRPDCAVMCNLINTHTHTHTHTHTQVSLIPPWEDQCEWHRMTRMTGPDCAVMCNLINTHTRTQTHTHTHTQVISGMCSGQKKNAQKRYYIPPTSLLWHTGSFACRHGTCWP